MKLKEDFEGLAQFSTASLVQERGKREGVSKITTGPYERFCIKTEVGEVESTGPAIILVILD